MRYAFAIDHRKCIGCHACTVACKTEHGVPLGEYRTWVKYVERGEFPHVRRYFTVLRCNHCSDAPCVTICPTSALYKRKDGVVDFDKDRCIGCKSCMQACPYDALYIDPTTDTAAKCNFCAHRLEVGLEPACVIVCPEQAIIAGDLDNPLSTISKLVNREPTEVRKPEQGTGPNVYYIGADSASLSPTAIARGQAYLWAQPKLEEGDRRGQIVEKEISTQHALQPRAMEAPLGTTLPAGKAAGGTEGAQVLGQVTYDVHHPAPWGWKVAAYLWTKGIAAGALLIPGLLVALGLAEQNRVLGIWAPLIALIFNAATAGLLITDLKRPDRFHYILTKGNWDSWLVRGAYILMAHGVISGLWFLSSWLGQEFLVRLLAWPAVLVALAAAGYTALLFGQCEGRDLWQSPLLLWHLLVQAALAGAAALILTGVLAGSSPSMIGTLAGVLTCAVALNGMLLVGENLSKPTNQDVALAEEMIWRGRFAPAFVCGVFGLEVVLPMVALVGFQAWTGGAPWVGAAAAVMGLVGLLIHEVVLVKAGQAVPLS